MAINRGIEFTSNVASGGTAHILDTAAAYSAGKLLSLRNNAVEKFYVDYDGNAFVSNAAGPRIVNAAATNSVPTLVPNQADPNTGVGWGGNDQLCLISGGGERMRLTLNSVTCYEYAFAGDVAGSYQLNNAAASSTTPTLCPSGSDLDTGIGRQAEDNLSMIAGGAEAGRFEDPADLAAGETSLWLFDDDNNAMEQVTVGAADSGGSGYKVLRIQN